MITAILGYTVLWQPPTAKACGLSVWNTYDWMDI